MDLNTFGTDVVKHLARIANAAEGIEAGMKSGGAKTTTSAPAAEKAAPAGKASTAKAKVEEKKETKPKHDFAEVKAVLITVKDTISKEAAQAVFKKYGYDAMSGIQPEHFDVIFDDATKALESTDSASDETEDDGL